jgi:phosphatidylethanolamine-binding protein (PEBP) family uncharacterized protein
MISTAPAMAGLARRRAHGVHHYRFRLLALSVPALRVARADPTCEEVERAAEAVTLAEASLIGTYRR